MRGFALLLAVVLLMAPVAAANTLSIDMMPLVIYYDVDGGVGATYHLTNYTFKVDENVANASWVVLGSDDQDEYGVLDARSGIAMQNGVNQQFNVSSVRDYRYFVILLTGGFTTGHTLTYVLNEDVTTDTPLYLLTPYLNWTARREQLTVLWFNMTGQGAVHNYSVLAVHDDTMSWTVLGTDEWDHFGSSDTSHLTHIEDQAGIPLVGGTPYNITFAADQTYNFFAFYISDGPAVAGNIIEINFWPAAGGTPHDPPNSTFTPLGEYTGCYPLTVSFTDTSTNTPTGWVWNFTNSSFTGGNGTWVTFSNSQNPPHTFSGMGNYTINLTASNAWGLNESVQLTWVNLTGSCAVTTPVPIYGVSNLGVDAPLDIAPLFIMAMSAVFVRVLKRRTRKGDRGS